MNAEPLTCKEFVELVTDYLEGAMPPAEKSRFEAHLAVCPGCQAYFQQIRQTVEWTGGISEEQIPEEAKGELLRAFRGWKKKGGES